METKRTLLAIAAFLIAFAAPAQTPYKGKLTVSNQTMTRQGDLLRLRMRVGYGTDVLNTGETLVITTVVKDSTHHCQLSSVIVPAKGATPQRLRGNYPVVAESNAAGERWFDYDTTVPFSSWMYGASFYIESEEKDARSSHIYEDLISQNLTIDSDSSHCAKPEWIDLLLPSAPATRLVTASSTISLADKDNIGQLKTRKFNETVAEHIANTFRQLSAGREMSLKEVVVKGYGAPIGNLRRNTIRGEMRAFELRNIFPKVCRLEYTLTLEDTSADKLRHDRFLTAGSGSGSLSVADLTVAASTYDKTSQEYAELLGACQSDTRSYANLGILHLLRGDRQKADIYLQMAGKHIDF